MGSNPTLSAQFCAACSRGGQHATIAAVAARGGHDVRRDDDPRRSADSDRAPGRSAHGIIPAPVSYAALPGETFELTPTTRIVVVADDPAVTAVAERFAAWLRRPTGLAAPRRRRQPAEGDIVRHRRALRRTGRRGLHLARRVERRAHRRRHAGRPVPSVDDPAPDAPAAVEATDVQPGPWTVAGAEIGDRPRFEYRGTMLDVARHFFAVDDVLRYIDLISLYKVNVLHLHLTDDQGWRLTVPGWPRLTEVGGPSDIDGGPGGFYSRRRLRPDRRVRRRALHRGRPRDRRPRPRVGRPHRLPGVELRRRRAAAVPPRRHLRGVAVCVGRLDLRVPRRRVRRPRRRAGPVHPHRRRRGDRHLPRRLPASSSREPPSSSSNAAGRR